MQPAPIVQPLQSGGRAGMDAGRSLREQREAERPPCDEPGTGGPAPGRPYSCPGPGGAETVGAVYRSGDHGGGYIRHVHGVYPVRHRAEREANRRGAAAGTAH